MHIYALEIAFATSGHFSRACRYLLARQQVCEPGRATSGASDSAPQRPQDRQSHPLARITPAELETFPIDFGHCPIMVVRNDPDCFHFIGDVVDRLHKRGAGGIYVKQAIRDRV